MESPPVVSTGGATDFLLSHDIRIGECVEVRGHHSAARLRWQSATIRIERTERRKKM